MYHIICGEKKIEISPENIQAPNFDIVAVGENRFHLINEGVSYNLELIQYFPETKEAKIRLNGKVATLKIKDRADLLLEKMGFNQQTSQKIREVKAPMPGLVHQLIAEEGQVVKKGEALLILEAMKMENIIKAPTDGKIATIKVKKGQNVDKNQVLVHFE